MGGAKTVDPSKYISKRDPSRDVLIATMMMQAQQQQMANQAEMLKQYAGMPAPQQTYDAAAQSQRAAELGLQNIQRQKELDRILHPEAAAMREAKSKQTEGLTSKENVDKYMREYMRTQGLPAQYETGLGDSTIGRAAAYDRALAARQAYEENLAAQRQAYLASTQAPVGGISPETSIAALQGVQAQNIAAQEAQKQAMFGNIAGFGQTGAQSAMQQFANLSALEQARQQSQQAYNQMLATGQQQAAESKNAMNAAYIGAAGNIASSALGAYGKMGAGAGSAITGYGGQSYVPRTSSTGGQYYYPSSGTV